jgi:hypothetical protein
MSAATAAVQPGNALTSSFGGDAIGRLVKIGMDTNMVSCFDVRTLLGASNNTGGGVGVDEDTGNVYATTGNQASGGSDTLLAFDLDPTDLKDDVGRIDNTTGIAISAGALFQPTQSRESR